MRVRYVALIVAVCAAFLGAIIATLARRETPQTQATPSPVTPTEASPSIPPLAAWKTYKNMEYGFEIRYPPHMDVTEEFVIDAPRFVIRGYRPIQTKDGFSAGDELVICPEGCGYFGVGIPTALARAPVTTVAGLPAKVFSGGTEDDSLTVSFIRTPTSRFLPFSDAQKNFGSIQTHHGPGNHRAALTEQILGTFRFLH